MTAKPGYKPAMIPFKLGDAKLVAVPQEPLPEGITLSPDQVAELKRPYRKTCGDCDHWKPPFAAQSFVNGTCKLTGGGRMEWNDACCRWKDLFGEIE